MNEYTLVLVCPNCNDRQILCIEDDGEVNICMYCGTPLVREAQGGNYNAELVA